MEKKYYHEWEERSNKEINFWMSDTGKETRLCLISQGYKNILASKLLSIIGCGFTILSIINNDEKIINNGRN